MYPSVLRLRPRRRHPLLLIAALLLAAAPPAGRAQPSAPALQPLTLDDYGAWSRIGQVALAPDGRWMTYAYQPNDGDATFFVHNLAGDTLRTAVNGVQPVFSDDSRWLGYLVDPPEAEAEQLRKKKEPVVQALHLIDLADNTRRVEENVASFALANGGGHAAVLKNRADRKADHRGADLLLHNLRTGVGINLGNVAEYAFNEAGTRLAYVVDAEGHTGNGLYLMELDAHRIRPLHTSPQRYTRLSWHDDHEALAALAGTTPDTLAHRQNTLLAFRDLSRPDAGMVVYNPADDPAFPAGTVISEHAALTWSPDGRRLFTGVKAQEAAADEEEDTPRANVDVWHWADERVQSVQMIQADRDRRFTYDAVVHLDGPRFLQLANDGMRRIQFTEDGRWGVGQHDAPYRGDVTQSGGRADYYRVDVETGARTRIATARRRNMGTSPDSQWFLYLEDGQVLAYHLPSGDVQNLSERAGVDFIDPDFDRPTEKPAYGVAGWSADGQWVVLNHKYDLWAVPLTSGEARNLTHGAGNADEIRFRYVRLDPEEEAIDLDAPVLLSAYGAWTKQSGYYRLAADGPPQPLLYTDKMIGGVRKALAADRLVFTQQTFVEFPDYWATDLSFRSPRRITDANPQQADYAWGRRVLVDYEDARGHRLQATLALPAGYEPGRRYPMVVYFYEKMSQRHHQYSMPVYDDRPHMSTYASNGYLVLMPDIIYDEGRPGSSALDDITSAVEAVIDLGYADPARIGLQGHSWGGYQSSFILTQTDLFAAVVTGAPLTNLMSMNNIVYKRTGNLNGPLIEWGQGRMGVTPYEDGALYRSQSPIHHVQHISTPFVILHGTEDGAVDWVQGLEFYSAARRMGKEVILLSYPGEPHHLAKEENQKDFQIRMKQFFDHYLTGAAPPGWMREGVPYLKKGKAAPEAVPAAIRQ